MRVSCQAYDNGTIVTAPRVGQKGTIVSSSSSPLPRVSPEAAGVSPAAVLAFLDALEDSVGGVHSFMLLRHGAVAAEGWWAPYAPHFPHSLFSLSKSFASTAVGLAVSEGLLTVEDPVVSFFADKLPESVPENLRAMRVHHLLSMSTGHDEDATGGTTSAADGDWVRAFLALPVEHAPGSKFVYNSAATYMCSAIVQRLTGQTLLEYLAPRLFEPLGIEGPAWESCPRGINIGGWGLSITTEDIARFGQCLLQEGCWDGRQLIPADWVRRATSAQVSNGDDPGSDWTQGYGYQFWMCRHGAYRGDGAFGQFCVVMPGQDAVLAMTGGHQQLQAALDAAWDHLLPGLDNGSEASGGDALRERLAGLALPAPEGDAASETADRVSGSTYCLEANDQGFESARFAFRGEGAEVTLTREGSELRIVSGYGRWAPGAAPGKGGTPRLGVWPGGRTAARGAWTDSDTYTMSVCYVETPFLETIAFRFTGEQLAVTRAMNVGFGPSEPAVLAGRRLG